MVIKLIINLLGLGELVQHLEELTALKDNPGQFPAFWWLPAIDNSRPSSQMPHLVSLGNGLTWCTCMLANKTLKHIK